MNFRWTGLDAQLAALFCAVALGIAGCGGGSSSDEQLAAAGTKQILSGGDGDREGSGGGDDDDNDRGDDDRDDRDDRDGHHGKGSLKARCGPGSVPETGLQGQVPAAVRAAGFKGYSCNLKLIGQSRNEGGSWQAAYFQDKRGHRCAYYDSASTAVIPGTAASGVPGTPRSQRGVAVIDATRQRHPVATTFLNTTAMIDPWESLKVNERRKLLGGVNSLNGNGGPEIELFDIARDCRYPQMLTGAQVGLGSTPDEFKAAVRGHEGNFAPDGLTYYAANLGAGYIYPIDITNPTKPKLLAQHFTPSPTSGRVHGLNISDDGNRAYVAILGQGLANPGRVAGSPPNNGLQILDTSEIQARKANPQMRVLGQVTWDDGGGAQHAINVKIKGKPYVIHVDEAGSGGNNSVGWNAACAMNLPAWQFARIIDVSDETKPTVLSKLIMEAYDPKNCAQVLPDLAGLGSFTYGAHYCSVDNRKDATTLACGYFNSGIRVFDIRNPARPREIAYFNPAGTTTMSPGSNHIRTGGWVAGGPDWCTAQVRLDAKKGTLETMCQDNGYLVLKFTNGVWPFRNSSTPPGLGN